MQVLGDAGAVLQTVPDRFARCKVIVLDLIECCYIGTDCKSAPAKIQRM